MDGHHKLIQCNTFVIHGAIDGYSRLIVFLYHQRFEQTYGGEIIEAWRYMIQHHQHENCVITRSLVHNERVKRLWQDVNRAVVSHFREIFGRLEREGILDVHNDVDLYCLHEIFKPRINTCLLEFMSSWNNHSSTEQNMTPLQLYHTGGNGIDTFSDSEDDSSQPSVGTTSSILAMASEAVEVSNLCFNLCTGLKVEMERVSQLPSQSGGYDLNKMAAQMLGQHLSRHCNQCMYDIH